MQATPSSWRMLLGSSWDNKQPLKVLCGGEALPKDLAGQICDTGSELWNMYGPTETTVWSSCERIDDPERAISLGEPVANTQLYILDEYCQPVPQGVEGELCIGGQGVTLGYMNRPELTEDRFIKDPFAAAGKLYRTGDKVRYRRDGSLEYLGRLDNQVKLRGYRLELGEIETFMRKHEGVQDCALAIREQSNGDARLVAYVVWKEQPLTSTEIRSFLRNWIPSFMIPQYIVDIDTLPKTQNGKLDRNALPDSFSVADNESEHKEPVTEQEAWLADVWKELIGVDKVGLYDNFFELGGHSLLSMQVIIRVSHRFNVKLSPRDLLLDSLEHIAAKITDLQVKENAAAKAVSEPGAKKGLLAKLFG